GDGVQPERLRGDPLGRRARLGRDGDVQAPRARGPDRAHGQLSALVRDAQAPGAVAGVYLTDHRVLGAPHMKSAGNIDGAAGARDGEDDVTETHGLDLDRRMFMAGVLCSVSVYALGCSRGTRAPVAGGAVIIGDQRPGEDIFAY